MALGRKIQLNKLVFEEFIKASLALAKISFYKIFIHFTSYKINSYKLI